MALQISERALAIKPSATLTVAARALALKAAGKDIVSLAAGEPDFDTPEHIKAAAVRALAEGFTKYTAVEGTPSLKRAVVEKLWRENGLEYAADQVLVSCGCKHSFYNLVMALLNPGDEAIIPAPYWTSYPDMVALTGARPVVIDTGIDDRFKVTPAKLAAGITPRTRLLVLNSPSNPTGEHYSRAELVGLAKVLLPHPRVLIASDDMYEHILWHEEPFANILNACPALYDRTVVLNGVSKAYAMTGWRIGYAAGPKPLIQAMAILQSQSTSNPTSIAQVAAEVALTGDQSLVRERCRIFKERHDFVHRRLNEMKGVRALPAQGTFYSFPNMEEAIERMTDVDDDVGLAERLLERSEVAVVPGTAFGAPGCVRVSFATSGENLTKALNRLETFFGRR
jgi:aspartate aminotransferase